MAGHSLGGSAALAASSRSNIDFRAVVVFDPAVQRLQPWRSPLPHPLLVVDSEEFTVGHEYQIFSSQILHTITTPGSPQVFSIGGATHPSFSDVFLILPGAINRLTGLSAPAPSVIARAVRAVEQFLGGEGGWGGRVGYEEVYRGEGERKMKMGEAARRARSKSRSKRMLGFGRKKGSGSEGESGGGESGDKDADAEEVLQEKGKGGRLYRPVTTPGQLAWHRL